MIKDLLEGVVVTVLLVRAIWWSWELYFRYGCGGGR